VADQVISLFAVTNGFVDAVPAERVQEFISGLLAHVKASDPELAESIESQGKIDEDTDAGLRKAIEAFRQSFK
jgi:F-type H+-transporting ATPase subunit alpha